MGSGIKGLCYHLLTLARRTSPSPLEPVPPAYDTARSEQARLSAYMGCMYTTARSREKIMHGCCVTNKSSAKAPLPISASVLSMCLCFLCNVGLLSLLWSSHASRGLEVPALQRCLRGPIAPCPPPMACALLSIVLYATDATSSYPYHCADVVHPG